ncbi:PREDICTED: putative trypsin-6 [Dinoponera quadriceps]|uniref:chymotrypsin n=1 Tax=Dinoponera quadriceps TaxID=609295 RepID=A0A6P3XA94_DINQU|nr:PREDICTED: putative trypsin-6 [Dinoponera quadriceps]
MGPMLCLLVFSVCSVLACSAHGLSKRYDRRIADLETHLETFRLTGRIVNGKKAISRQFPHQVSLRRSLSGYHFCGGSIISDKFILTAGHCVDNGEEVIKAWTVTVVAGELRTDRTTLTAQRRGVKTIEVHPKFNRSILLNDVAILELTVPFVFTPEVSSVPLLSCDPTPKTLCAVSGWGYLSEDGIQSPDLMYVELPIREPKECQELLVNVTEMYLGMFCAGFLQGGKDACQGDSGGGMVCNNVLTGVVSGGEGCARPQTPGVYSNVHYFSDWILHYLGKNCGHSQLHAELHVQLCAQLHAELSGAASPVSNVNHPSQKQGWEYCRLLE